MEVSALNWDAELLPIVYARPSIKCCGADVEGCTSVAQLLCIMNKEDPQTKACL